eukprot:6184879-Pleurochrysis_carterae.AAC.2
MALYLTHTVCGHVSMLLARLALWSATFACSRAAQFPFEGVAFRRLWFHGNGCAQPQFSWKTSKSTRELYPFSCIRRVDSMVEYSLREAHILYSHHLPKGKA